MARSSVRYAPRGACHVGLSKREAKVPVNATEAEKIAIRDQQKEVAELRAQLEIAETKL